MALELPDNVIDRPELRNRSAVFRDRTHAGEVLAGMLAGYDDALVLGIPAGGVPVALVIARQLGLPLEVAVVSKITLPWNTESGYGAVAFDGTVRLNERLLPRLGLNPEQIRQGTENTLAKVGRRMARLRGDQPLAVAGERPVILVDDGLASGITLLAACEALAKAGAERIVVAVPTAHTESVRHIAAQVEALYCANLRKGWSFAVADAYEFWSDVAEEQVLADLQRYRGAR